MAFTTIAVGGKYQDEAGNNLTGTVEFMLTTTLHNGIIIAEPVRVVCPLVTGSFTTNLIATNDADTLPVGAGYRVIERVGGITRTYTITVPYNSPSGALDLATVTPAVLTDPVTSYATVIEVNRLATYDVSGGAQGLIGVGANVMTFVSSRAWSLPANLSGSAGYAGTNPTAQATFDVQKNGVSFGSMVIATNGTFTFSAVNPVTFVKGDRLTVIAPNPADATLKDVSFTFWGQAT